MCIRDRLNVVFGGGAGAAGEFLVEMLDERRLDKIAFTGSTCLLYTSDAADERSSVDLGGRRIIKKKKTRSDTVSVR